MVETEKALIGCMILDDSKIPDIMHNIKKTDFTNPECRFIYTLICSRYNKSSTMDLVAIYEEAKEKNSNIDMSLLVEMTDIVATTESYNYYINKIKQSSIKRSIIKITHDIQQKLRNNDYDDIDSFKNECIEKFNFDTRIKSIIDEPVINYTENWLKEIKANKNKSIIGTGFPFLNQKLGGGIFTGLYVIGAPSSLGKTAFLLQIADKIAEYGEPVLYISTEMAKIELVSRSISRKMFEFNREKCKYMTTQRILRGDFYNYVNEMNEALKQYEDTAKKLTIQKCSFNANINQIKSIVKAYINKTSQSPVVVIDYLQTLKADGYDKTMFDNVVSGLKDIAVDFNIPVLVISSFNRASYSGKVDFESFKETGMIEYTADVLIGLQLTVLDELDLTEKNKSRNKETLANARNENPRRVTAVIIKQRNAKAWAKQNFLFFAANNYFQEIPD